MKYLRSHYSFKLYSVTEQDIAESGGEGTSRLIKNDVLVFMPDIERPEIGLEIKKTNNEKEAYEFIEEYLQKPMQGRFDEVRARSAAAYGDRFQIEEDEETRR